MQVTQQKIMSDGNYPRMDMPVFSFSSELVLQLWLAFCDEGNKLPEFGVV